MNDLSLSEPSWAYKGWPHRPPGTTLDHVVDEGLNIFNDGFLFPVATISSDDLEHNITTMARFCRENDVSLAPHAKTTMSPEIVKRQLASGAWAITAATASQAQVFRQFGVERIVVAHQVVDPAAVRWIADELEGHAHVNIMCLVDSVEAVDAMETALADSLTQRPIDVLVELGVKSGRTGCRSVDDAVELGQALAGASHLRLVGVEGFEGLAPVTDGDFSSVDGMLSDIATTAERLDSLRLFRDVDEIILTAGGSLFPDRAVNVLRGASDLSKPTRLVIRSGCYVTHDSGMYEAGGPFGERTPMHDYPALRSAMRVWSYVVSVPEPGLAILGFGKRDASHDVDLPRPLTVRRNGLDRSPDPGELEVFALNDQHAFVRITNGFDLAVGDIVGCGISHPCTTFDKWRAIPLVDDHFDVVGTVRTFF